MGNNANSYFYMNHISIDKFLLGSKSEKQGFETRLLLIQWFVSGVLGWDCWVSRLRSILDNQFCPTSSYLVHAFARFQLKAYWKLMNNGWKHQEKRILLHRKPKT